MSVLSHKEPNKDDVQLTIKIFSEGTKRETWTQVECDMNDGSTQFLWKSSKRVGYFKQVFVPFDFEDKAIA